LTPIAGRTLREIAAGLAAAGFYSRQDNVFAAKSRREYAWQRIPRRTTARGKRILNGAA
jgi:hypothetical protein